MWIAKLKHEHGEFEAETLEKLIAQIVEKYGCDYHEWKVPDVEYLTIRESDGAFTDYSPNVLICQLETAMRHAKESYDCIDPMEHRSHPL